MRKTKINNYCEIKIKGLNQDKFINKIYKKYNLFDIKKVDYNILSLKINLKDEKNIKKELINNNFEILKIKHFGLKYLFKTFLKRYGIITGILIILVGVLLSNKYILKTEIIGNDLISTTEINECLKEYGISTFTNKNNIDCEEIEKYLTSKFDKLSLVSIIKKGNSLVINIKEKVVNDEYENIDSFVPLVSNENGRILSIKLIQGTLNVKVGDLISKGDILVQPYIYDSSNELKKVKPQAEIVAEIWHEESYTHYDKKVVTERTGKTYVEKQISLCGIDLMKTEGCNFGSYEKESSEINFSIFLPIKSKTNIYYETTKVTKVEPFEEVKESLIEKCRKNALLKVQDCEIINKEYHKLISGAGVHTIVYVIQTEKQVGVYENQL